MPDITGPLQHHPVATPPLHATPLPAESFRRSYAIVGVNHATLEQIPLQLLDSQGKLHVRRYTSETENPAYFGRRWGTRESATLSRPHPIDSHFRILAVRHEPIKRMRGFTTQHRVPTAIDHRALTFVEQLTRATLDDDLQSMFERIRELFAFKRRDFVIHGPEQRRGVIETPLFIYEITVGICADDPSRVQWRRAVSGIETSKFERHIELDQCLGPADWQLELDLEKTLDLTALVDLVEERELPQISLRYDKDLAWCELEIAGSTGTLRFTSESLQMIPAGTTSPSGLLQALGRFQTQLAPAFDRRIMPVILQYPTTTKDRHR